MVDTTHTCDDCGTGKQIEVCLCNNCLDDRISDAREEGRKEGKTNDEI